MKELRRFVIEYPDMLSPADIDADALRERIDAGAIDKPTLRLAVALNYAHGTGVEALSETYGVPERTIYSWLRRHVDRDSVDALYDEPRPGRPPKLSATERRRLYRVLTDEKPPSGESWTPRAVVSFVEREYDRSVSDRHARRWLDEPDRLIEE